MPLAPKSPELSVCVGDCVAEVTSFGDAAALLNI